MSVRNQSIEFFYPGLNTLGISLYDSTVVFYGFVDHLLPSDCILLDFGAGRGTHFTQSPDDRQSVHNAMNWLAPKVNHRIGCDVDPVVLENKALDKAYVLEAKDDHRIPLDDESCDCVIVDWVVEHLPNPLASFKDIWRVLRPGGTVCIRTSNQWHYSYLVAAAVADTKLEGWLLNRSQPDRDEVDVFPKLYRANSRSRLRKQLSEAGYSDYKVLTFDPTSAYMNFSLPTTLIGGVYHRIASAGIVPRAVLMGFARK